MDFSFNMTFDDETQISTNTNLQVTNGLLKPLLGGTTGTVVTVTTTADDNITQAYMVANGNAINEITFFISNNGGSSWEVVTPKTLYTFSSTGNQLRVKIQMNSGAAELDSLVVMYK